MSAGQTTSAVTDDGLITVRHLGDEGVRIGDACRLFHRFSPGHAIRRGLRSIDTKGNVVIHRVVEQDRFLAHDAHQRAQVMRAELPDIRAVNGHSALLRVIEPRHEVREGRLTAARLTNQCHRLPLRDREVDIRQHFALLISERDMVKGDCCLDLLESLRVGRFDYVRLRVEHRINAFQRRQTATNTVRRFAQVFGGVDDGIEDDQIIDEGRSIDGRVVSQDQQSAEPQDDGNERRSEELRQRMREVITAIDAIEGGAGCVDELCEAGTQFILRIESLHDPQTEQGLVNRREDLRVLFLSFG